MAIGPVQLLVLGFSERPTSTARSSPSSSVCARATGARDRRAGRLQGRRRRIAVEHLSTCHRTRRSSSAARSARSSASASRASKASWPAPRRAPRRPPTASSSSTTRTPGRPRRDSERLGAALVLLEHHWAVPLRDAVMRAAASASPTASSAARSRRDRPRHRRGGRAAARPGDRRRTTHLDRGVTTCSDPAESPGAPAAAPHDASPRR